MTMITERCDHNRFASQLAERITSPVALRPAAVVPAAGRAVSRTDNQPPAVIEGEATVVKTTIDHGREAFAELAAYLKETPVITCQAEARQGSGFLERTRIAIAEMEAERTAKVKPLNDEVGRINAAYRAVRDPLETALKALRARLTGFAAAEEAKRIAEANRLREEAEARERAAREAEAAERQAMEDAEAGECTDVGAAIEQADAAFDDFARANRAAARAERAVPVRFSSVTGGRAQAMRTVEVLKIEDAVKAIRVMGLTEKIAAAILSSARDYRKEFDELPEGVIATFERSI
jgi:hypothetical protein